MIRCGDCVLDRSMMNCRKCRNMIGKMYLDFLCEVRDLVFGPKNSRERVYAVQDSVKLEEEMINSFSPETLEEAFHHVGSQEDNL